MIRKVRVRVAREFEELSSQCKIEIENIAARLRASRQYQGPDLTGRRGLFTRSSLLCFVIGQIRRHDATIKVKTKVISRNSRYRRDIMRIVFARAFSSVGGEVPLDWCSGRSRLRLNATPARYRGAVLGGRVNENTFVGWGHTGGCQRIVRVCRQRTNG